SSGSERSAYGVKSTRSTNSTLISRRSSVDTTGAAGERAAPQPVQNAAPDGHGRPHCGQALVSGAPQPPQNRSPSAAGWPHRGQAILRSMPAGGSVGNRSIG